MSKKYYIVKHTFFSNLSGQVETLYQAHKSGFLSWLGTFDYENEVSGTHAKNAQECEENLRKVLEHKNKGLDLPKVKVVKEIEYD